MNKRLHAERQLLLAKIRLDRLVIQGKFVIGPAAKEGTNLTGLWRKYAVDILQKSGKYPLWAGAAVAAIVAFLPRHAIGNTLRHGAVIAERIFSQPESGLSLLFRILPVLFPTVLEIIESVRRHDNDRDK